MQEQENNSKETKEKIPFFKKVLISIKDFDKYEMFAKENARQAVLYLLKMMAIFSVVVSVISVFNFSENLADIVQKFDEAVETLSYSEGIVSINNNEKYKLENFNDNIGKVIIDTSDLNDEQLGSYKAEIVQSGNGAIILKDKIIIINTSLSAIAENDYATILSAYNINSLDKQTILNYYNNNSISIYVSVGILMFIYVFAIYTINVLLDCIILAALTFLTGKIVKLKLKVTAAFNISVHSITLPLILNMIYIVINFFTGFTIKYFQIMYTTIAYIYIITAILMIKSDFIKNQMEVQKIVSEQEKIKEAIKQKEEKEKELKEKEDVKKRDKEKDSTKKKDSPTIGENPEGDNA